MQCPNPDCKEVHGRSLWTCPSCNSPLPPGVVFVTGISGSDSEGVVRAVSGLARSDGHDHRHRVHDVGEIMHKHASSHFPGLPWDRVLDASPMALTALRALAFQQISYEITAAPDDLHLVDLHLLFRWKPYLSAGFEPYMVRPFIPSVRLFINLIADLSIIQERLAASAWGKREILELLIWRDEELHMTDMFADFCGRVESFAVATAEPPATIERLIWHPEIPKIYLSFPITALADDENARAEIARFRDQSREFLTVFDPFACRDYDETYRRPEMQALRAEIGETTRDRDFRFIDQADAIVVYFPRKVPSKGVDAEMNHARATGKPIYLYCPEELGGGPFAVPADHYRNDPAEYLALLKSRLAPARH